MLRKGRTHTAVHTQQDRDAREDVLDSLMARAARLVTIVRNATRSLQCPETLHSELSFVHRRRYNPARTRRAAREPQDATFAPREAAADRRAAAATLALADTSAAHLSCREARLTNLRFATRSCSPK